MTTATLDMCDGSHEYLSSRTYQQPIELLLPVSRETVTPIHPTRGVRRAEAGS